MAKPGWPPIAANCLMPEWLNSPWPNYVEDRTAVSATASPAEWRVANSNFVADDEATARPLGLSAEGPDHCNFKQPVRKLVGVRGTWQSVQSRPRHARRGHPSPEPSPASGHRRHGGLGGRAASGLPRAGSDFGTRP